MDRRRLTLEIEEMRRRFPQFRPLVLRDGRHGFEGTLRTKSWNSYRVLGVYQSTYPYSAPKVYPISPRISTKHQFDDGSMCFHLAHEWSPSYTMCVAIGWASHWLHAYESYKRTGYWPGLEV